MLSSLFPVLYALALIILLWQAFRVMGRGFWIEDGLTEKPVKARGSGSDRTGRLTIQHELLDQEGQITDEELLTVRFSEDIDPPKSAETSAE